MDNQTNIANAVIAAVEEVLKMSGDLEAKVTRETVLLGDEAILDSMGFVNFVVNLEEKILAIRGESIDVHALFDGDKSGSLKSTGSLIDALAQEVS